MGVRWGLQVYSCVMIKGHHVITKLCIRMSCSNAIVSYNFLMNFFPVKYSILWLSHYCQREVLWLRSLLTLTPTILFLLESLNNRSLKKTAKWDKDWLFEIPKQTSSNEEQDPPAYDCELIMLKKSYIYVNYFSNVKISAGVFKTLACWFIFMLLLSC